MWKKKTPTTRACDNDWPAAIAQGGGGGYREVPTCPVLVLHVVDILNNQMAWKLFTNFAKERHRKHHLFQNDCNAEVILLRRLEQRRHLRGLGCQTPCRRCARPWRPGGGRFQRTWLDPLRGTAHELTTGSFHMPCGAPAAGNSNAGPVEIKIQLLHPIMAMALAHRSKQNERHRARI